MYRRAALAQLLACGKGVLVLDEPFASLDNESAEEVLRTLIALKKSGVAFILISHRDVFVKVNLLTLKQCDMFILKQCVMFILKMKTFILKMKMFILKMKMLLILQHTNTLKHSQ